MSKFYFKNSSYLTKVSIPKIILVRATAQGKVLPAIRRFKDT